MLGTLRPCMEILATDATRGRVAAEDGGPDRLIPKGDGARPLPRGSHGIPAELIAQDQRNRIVAATTRVASERGYGATTVSAVTKRAGVSTATFYRQFSSLDECMLATFWELHRRLMAQIAGACAAEQPADRPRAGLRRALRILATDAQSARLLTVEILAAGSEGARSQHQAIAITAEQLGIDSQVGWGLVALVAALVSRKVIAGEAETLPLLEYDLGIVLTASKALR